MIYNRKTNTFKGVFPNKYSNYPCEDYLNNALRWLFRMDKSDYVDRAVMEIVHCMQHSKYQFFTDVERILKEDGYIK